MRIVSAAEVHAALAFETLADAIAETLRASFVSPQRHAHKLGDIDSLLLMPAWDAEVIGVKLVSVMPGNAARARNTVNASYMLMDRASGEPIALIDGEALTLRRTAAASLLAARYLAPAHVENVLIVGTGKLAPYMARAHATGRKLRRLRIWGRDAAKAERIAKDLRGEGLPAERVDNLEAAISDSQLISCATTALAPVVLGKNLNQGTHLDLVGAFRRGMREVDDGAVACSLIYVDTFEGALAEASDIVEPLERGVISRAQVLGDLAQLVTGSSKGRIDQSAITLFKSVGAAFEDLAAAKLLMRSA